MRLMASLRFFLLLKLARMVFSLLRSSFLSFSATSTRVGIALTTLSTIVIVAN